MENTYKDSVVSPSYLNVLVVTYSKFSVIQLIFKEETEEKSS